MSEKISKPSTKKDQLTDGNVKDFFKTVHMLIELLGRDMESANPSRDKDMLIAIRDGLFRVEVSGQLFDCVKAFRTILAKHYPEVAIVEFNRMRHIELAKNTAKLSVQSLSGKGQVRDFFKAFGVDMENIKMAIFAITQFIETVRRLPIKFFVDPDNRFQIISSLQHELDDFIILEENQEQETSE